MEVHSLRVFVWQVIFLGGIALWVILCSLLNVTIKIRSLIQPWVCDQVSCGTPFILAIQRYQHGVLDALFTGLSFVVSVPFYTAFLPLVYWSGHSKLFRQLTLLLAFCDYIGNSTKDLISAPRPSSPPVTRIKSTKEEEDNAMEYGLPSSHTLNTLCLAGYLLHYILSYYVVGNIPALIAGVASVIVLVVVTGLGRIYLGMHSFIDIMGGLVLGSLILALWLAVQRYIDDFVVSGKNVVPFWSALSLLLLFAYPTPELPTPSFDFHTAFNGVALGAVVGIHQTRHHFHHEDVPRLFKANLSLLNFSARVAVGIPIILLVKFCSKALAKWILPILAKVLSIPIKSGGYVSALCDIPDYEKPVEMRQTESGGYVSALRDTPEIEKPVEMKQTESGAYVSVLCDTPDIENPAEMEKTESSGYVSALRATPDSETAVEMTQTESGGYVSVLCDTPNEKIPAEMKQTESSGYVSALQATPDSEKAVEMRQTESGGYVSVLCDIPNSKKPAAMKQTDSSCYVSVLCATSDSEKAVEMTETGYLQKLFSFSHQHCFDVDTGIRFIQYTGLAWSVVALVPYVFSRLGI